MRQPHGIPDGLKYGPVIMRSKNTIPLKNGMSFHDPFTCKLRKAGVGNLLSSAFGKVQDRQKQHITRWKEFLLPHKNFPEVPLLR
jgi:hypothetical protein